MSANDTLNQLEKDAVPRAYLRPASTDEVSRGTNGKSHVITLENSMSGLPLRYLRQCGMDLKPILTVFVLEFNIPIVCRTSPWVYIIYLVSTFLLTYSNTSLPSPRWLHLKAMVTCRDGQTVYSMSAEWITSSQYFSICGFFEWCSWELFSFFHWVWGENTGPSVKIPVW